MTACDNSLSYHFVLSKMNVYGNADNEIPSSITLVRLPSGDQLFINEVPVPSQSWKYDSADRILLWRKLFGGGHLLLAQNGRGATGIIGPSSGYGSVRATAITRFAFDIRPTFGATFI